MTNFTSVHRANEGPPGGAYVRDDKLRLGTPGNERPPRRSISDDKLVLGPPGNGRTPRQGIRGDILHRGTKQVL